MTKYTNYVRVLAMAFLAGCAAQSEVKYFDLKQDTEGMYKFTLPKSDIHLGLVKSEQRGEFIDAVSVPTDAYTDAESYSLMMQPVSSIFQDTNITQLTTLPNTRVPSAVGSEVTDHRAQIIETLAMVAGAMVPLEHKQAPTRFNPTTIELKPVVNAPLPSNPDWKYSLRLGDPPDDAVSFTDFKKLSNGGKLEVFPFSACRDAKLTLTPPAGRRQPSSLRTNKCDDEDMECILGLGTPNEANQKPAGNHKIAFSLKVADPSSVSLIRIPTKGQITMHSACGIDVKSDKGSGSSVDWSLLGKLIQEAKNSKETIDKNKK